MRAAPALVSARSLSRGHSSLIQAASDLTLVSLSPGVSQNLSLYTTYYMALSALSAVVEAQFFKKNSYCFS